MFRILSASPNESIEILKDLPLPIIDTLLANLQPESLSLFLDKIKYGFSFQTELTIIANLENYVCEYNFSFILFSLLSFYFIFFFLLFS